MFGAAGGTVSGAPTGEGTGHHVDVDIERDQVQKITILDRSPSTDEGEPRSTTTVKRPIVHDDHRDAVAALSDEWRAEPRLPAEDRRRGGASR